MSKGTSTSRCLWKGERNRDDKRKTSVRGYSEIYADYSCTPKPRTFWDLAAHSLVVGQEFALGCYFIARHRVLLTQNLRDPKVNVAQSDKAIYFTLGMVLCASLMARHVPQPNRRAKAKQRLADGVLLAILLRLLAGLWRTLTLSYSSDTVQALAIGGMLLHVLTCDYGWANGKGEFESLKYKQRQPFRGGTLSLNAALFTTTLLVSRLDSQASAFILVGLAIVAFGFYPDTRHVISLAYPASGSCMFPASLIVYL